MRAVLSKLRPGQIMRLGAIIVIGVSIVAVSAKVLPALPQSDDVRSFDVDSLEAAVFIDDSWRAMRQDAAESDSRAPLFGMETEPVAAGGLLEKWHHVEAAIAQDFAVVAQCHANGTCPVAAQRLIDISAKGAGRSGRARVGRINRAADLAISPVSDEMQWGVVDHWSDPFETLRSNRGDCEDYAILKYAALQEAGFPRDDVKIVI